MSTINENYTFRNVSLSLVTMEGFTRMLSCMMDVKLWVAKE